MTDRTFTIGHNALGSYVLQLFEGGQKRASAILHEDPANPGSALANAAAMANAWIAFPPLPQPGNEPAGTVPAERDRCVRICLEQAESARRVMDKVADPGGKSALLYGAVVAESCAAVIASGSGA